MTFEEALVELKKGKGIYRDSWEEDEFIGYWTLDYNEPIMKYYWDSFRGRIHQTVMEFSSDDILADDWGVTEVYRCDPDNARFIVSGLNKGN
jgi:hypothetical protein